MPILVAGHVIGARPPAPIPVGRQAEREKAEAGKRFESAVEQRVEHEGERTEDEYERHDRIAPRPVAAADDRASCGEALKKAIPRPR